MHACMHVCVCVCVCVYVCVCACVYIHTYIRTNLHFSNSLICKPLLSISICLHLFQYKKWISSW